MNGRGVVPKLTVSNKIETFFFNLANRGMDEVFDTIYLNAPGVVLKLTSPTRDVKFFESGQKGGINFYMLKTANMGCV